MQDADRSRMEIKKSSRHSKITGDFAERLVLYWLSKYGFESAYVDHVGVDIIARNPNNNELMGISVKSRSRTVGSERVVIRIERSHFEKLERACTAFDCIPYLAIVVDAATTITVFIVSAKHFLKHFSPSATRGAYWKMTAAALKQYEGDPEVRSFRFTAETLRWWSAAAKARSQSGSER
jgi:Holliday junction resolvase-like predicted endonuclease